MENFDINQDFEQDVEQKEENSSKNEKRFMTLLLVCFLLILFLLSITGWVVYDKFASKRSIDDLQKHFASVDSSRSALKHAYNMALQRMDSLNTSNTELQQELDSRKSEIEKLNSDIDRIVKSKDADLRKANEKIREMGIRINELLAEIDRLNRMNKTLLANTTTVINGKDTLYVTSRPIKIDGELATPMERSAVGLLHASAVSIAAIDGKGGDKSTTLSKNVDYLRVSFTLDESKNVPSGSKELYLVLIGPDGNPISNPSANSGNFKTAQGDTKTYTARLSTDYNPAKGSKVDFDWKQNARFNVGDYKAEIYHNGEKIGEGKEKLKRGIKPYPF
ncbi:MAG: hypothetical protein J0I41_10465 [Filimonas sp.]|nr:hypothetical protein [Filimonas sp.]